MATATVALRQLAHGRTGDKGNRSNVSVIAYRPAYWEAILAQVTEEAVMRAFAHRAPRRVVRYVLPRLHALNFVLDDVLDGGVNDALNLDSHGKSLAFLVLDLPVTIDSRLMSPNPAAKPEPEEP